MADFILTKGGNSAVNEGGGNDNWNNVTNVLALDGNYARVDVTKNDTSKYAKAYNYQFNIPDDATINGVIMRITRYSENDGNITDNEVYLIDTSRNPKGSNKATSTGWAESAETVAYGGSSDLWGASWTVADINNANFGIAISTANDASSNRNSYIDYLEISIHYSRPDATPIMLAMGAF